MSKTATEEKPVPDEAAPTPTEPSPFASFEDLIDKPRRERTVTLHLANGDEASREVKVKIRALSAKGYDELVAKHPPKKGSGSFDADTFGPALLAASFVAPSLTEEQARALWHSESWAGGEVTSLFQVCLELNHVGFDVPFTALG